MQNGFIIIEKKGVDVGFFDFFKRKRNVENIKTEVDKTYDSETGLKIGQKLFAQNGELVTVCAIKEKQ
jgi:hypothetical protein